MKFLSKCQNCKRRVIYINKRVYKVPALGTSITSQKELCGRCYNAIKKMI